MESSTTNTPSLPKRKRINRTTLAYIAGILDGEGTITGYWKKPDNCVVMKVHIYNTHRELMQWLSEVLDSPLCQVPARPGRKPQWQLNIRTRDLKWFLKLMIPFLRVKQKQLRIALIIQSMTERGAKLERKLKWLDKLHSLNQGKMIESVPTAM